jgi:hypothetical protein
VAPADPLGSTVRGSGSQEGDACAHVSVEISVQHSLVWNLPSKISKILEASNVDWWRRWGMPYGSAKQIMRKTEREGTNHKLWQFHAETVLVHKFNILTYRNSVQSIRNCSPNVYGHSWNLRVSEDDRFICTAHKICQLGVLKLRFYLFVLEERLICLDYIMLVVAFDKSWEVSIALLAYLNI